MFENSGLEFYPVKDEPTLKPRLGTCSQGWNSFTLAQRTLF